MSNLIEHTVEQQPCLQRSSLSSDSFHISRLRVLSSEFSPNGKNSSFHCYIYYYFYDTYSRNLYRSKRRGFNYYVQGQIKEISKNFAMEIQKLEIEMKKQEVLDVF
jgi:hypothetical protein